MTVGELRDALEGGRLSRFTEDILEMASPCVRVRTLGSEMEALSLGESRIGGHPDVPRSFEWPIWDGRRLSFIAQFNLKDVPSIPLQLPSEGSLLFFYDSAQGTWGFDPKDRGSFAVRFIPPGDELVRVDPPPARSEDGFYPCCRIQFVPQLSLPPWDSMLVGRLQLSDEDADEYFDLLERSLGDDLHQLGGYPDQVQGDMTIELPLVTAGLYTGDSSGWKDPRAENLQKQWRNWRLLFQAGSDDNARMMWGDMGYLYFWIEEDALASRSFDRAWMILQCS